METPWHYLVNQFLNATEGNYKKMLKLSNYHDAYLLSMSIHFPDDSDYSTLYDTYHPVHELFVSRYTSWKSAGGLRKGQTDSLEQMFRELVPKLNKWDALVQSIDSFEKGTSNYISIFPNGHAPFLQGAITARINTVKVLGETLGTYVTGNPDIAAIKVLVDDFYSKLDLRRDTQEGAKGGTKLISEEVEAQRKVTAQEQYNDLCFLMNKFSETPGRVASFFELNVLRSTEQVHYTGSLKAAGTEALLTHTFLGDDELRIQVTNPNPEAPSTQLAFYLASTPNGKDSTAVTIMANAGKFTFQAADFGLINFATHRYLTGVNDTAFDLNYTIDLL